MTEYLHKDYEYARHLNNLLHQSNEQMSFETLADNPYTDKLKEEATKAAQQLLSHPKGEAIARLCACNQRVRDLAGCQISHKTNIYFISNALHDDLRKFATNYIAWESPGKTKKEHNSIYSELKSFAFDLTKKYQREIEQIKENFDKSPAFSAAAINLDAARNIEKPTQAQLQTLLGTAERMSSSYRFDLSRDKHKERSLDNDHDIGI